MPVIEPVTIEDATLYCGDAREIAQLISPCPEAIITDPVWPNGENMFPGIDAPKLLRFVLDSLIDAKRVAITMRADSDPRFLQNVSSQWPFICVQWLEYAVPGFVGRTLGGNEINYGFGEPIAFQKGRQLIPGRAPKAQPGRAGIDHPCPRPIEHVQWLVYWWSDEGETVIDPFMGSGTTGIACANLGRRFVGIESERKYFDIACERIEAAYAQQRLFA